MRIGKNTYKGIKIISDYGNSITFTTQSSGRIFEAKWGRDGSGNNIWVVSLSKLDPLRNDRNDRMRHWTEYFPRQNNNNEIWAFFASSIS
jgi:hypothetical protein